VHVKNGQAHSSYGGFNREEKMFIGENKRLKVEQSGALKKEERIAKSTLETSRKERTGEGVRERQ